MSSARSEFISGIKVAFPMLLGIAPFGIICGIAAIGKGHSNNIALAMSIIISAGTAQLATLELMANNTHFLTIVLTASVINLRFVMYSASLAPHFQQLSLKWKLLISYLLSDPVYAASITRYNREPAPANKHWYYLGVAIALWLIWQGGTVIGVFLGALVPASWQLDFAIPLTFLALAMPAIADRATLASGVVAALIAAIAFSLPMNLGLMVAAGIAILTGLFVESKLGGDRS